MYWQIDDAHSEINFTVRHMMIAKVRGQFEQFSGTIEFDPDQPENTTVDVQIVSNSINTREEDRDNHLRSPDFLNAEEYPYLTFKSTAVELTSENTARLTGDLTIRDVTKAIKFEVKYNGTISMGEGKGRKAGFKITGSVDRFDYGLKYDRIIEAGGLAVSRDIAITCNVELNEVNE